MNRILVALIAVVLVVILTLLNIGKVLPLSVREMLKGGKPVNILLLGIDARPDETNARSDTIILSSYNRALNKAVMVWVPRDTRITSPNASQKINMVTQLQGPEATCKEVGKLLGTNVDYYVLTNFSSFEKMIDILGGVYIDVDINLSSPASGVYLTKGYKRLNGKEALKYARYRGRLDGDIGRTQRQQKLIKALAHQILQSDSIDKIPELLAALRQNVQTNLSVTDMLYLANIMIALDEDDIVTQTLPGRAYADPFSGASYWEADRQVARNLLESLFNGETFEIDLQDLPEAR